MQSPNNSVVSKPMMFSNVIVNITIFTVKNVGFLCGWGNDLMCA